MSLDHNKDNYSSTILALEECLCQAVTASRNLTDNSFVMEDMAAMLPLLTDADLDIRHLYGALDQSMLRSMDPAHESSTTTILPQLPSDSANITVSTEEFNSKLTKFVYEISKISSILAGKIKDSYTWLTTKQNETVYKLQEKKLKYILGVDDTIVTCPSWRYKNKECRTVDDAVDMAEYYLNHQLDPLIQYCKHCVFVLDQVDALIEGVLIKSVSEQKLTTIYKSHNSSNIEKILRAPETTLIDGSTISVSDSGTRATTTSEMMTSIMALNVLFDKATASKASHNTPSATRDQTDNILKVVAKLIEATDISKSDNPLGLLIRQAEHLESSSKKIEISIKKHLDELSEEDRDQNLLDAARLMSVVTIQSLNFGINTYSVTMDICSKLLSLIKLKV